MCAPSPGWWENLHMPSRGTLSPHSAVILTVSDIFSLLCVVPYDMTNKSPSKVILRYSLSSPVVARPCTRWRASQMKTFFPYMGGGQPVLTRTSRP